MTAWFEWLSDNWTLIAIPILVFLATYIIGLWLRILLYRLIGHWQSWNRWRGSKPVADSMRRPIIDWFLLLGAFLAIQSSALEQGYKNLAGLIIASLFVASLAWVTISIGEKLIRVYGANTGSPKRQITVGITALRIIIIIIRV
jgi:hypothetical protein